MKLSFNSKMKARVLCVCLALSMMLSACGTTKGAAPSTEAAGNLTVTETQAVSVDTEAVDKVASPATEVAETTEVSETKADATEEAAESELTEEEKAWQNNVMAKVDNALNVRVEPKQDAELAGKLQKGDLATVVEKGDEWTKIKSGNLEGYVSNEFCVYGTDALAYAKENCETVVTATGEGLRVREAMNTESKIIKRLSKGDKLTVDKSAKVEDGWIAVVCDGKTGYVSADFVSVGLNLGKGLTMEEIREIKRQQEEAERAAEEQNNDNDNNDNNNGGGSGKDDDDDDDKPSKPVNADDATLLAALVYCEAGGEPYAAQLGVASVVMNRVRSSKFPNTVKAVIYQRGQFGPASSGKLARRLASGKVSSSCLKAAKSALAGNDNTNGALYFSLASSGKKGVVHGRIVFH